MSAKTILKECSLFFGLNDSELEKIVGMTQEKEFEAGASIFSAGDSANDLYVIEEGRVAIQMALPKTLGYAARRITVDVVSKNEIVGWSAIVEPYRYTFNAMCMQHTIALSINAAKLKALLRDNSVLDTQVMKGLIKILAAGLNDARQILISERLLASQE